MRSEQQMIDLILNYAKADERVRLVGLDGSRGDPGAPKDKLRDYDVAFAVTDMKSFIEQGDDWLDYFGARIIMQKPEAAALFPPDLGGWFSYLMLFQDGNRIDLILLPLEDMPRYFEDSLVAVLLDKDSRAPARAPASAAGYNLKPPTQQTFDDCCNEFWWVSTYVAKGLRRHQLVYAAKHVDHFMRDMLLLALAWLAAAPHDYKINFGSGYKYLGRWLDEALHARLLATYDLSAEQSVWRALFDSAALFSDACAALAAARGLEVPRYEQDVLPYLKAQHEAYLNNESIEVDA